MNTVNLIGRTTADLELKYTPSGKAVAKFSIAISKIRMAEGEKKEEVSFIEVQVWEKLAENTYNYVKKGHRIGVVGELKQDRWEQEDGTKRNKLYVIARNVEFLETKPKTNEAENSAPDNNNNGWAE